MIEAVVLSVVSACCYAAAAVVQERLAARGHRGYSRWALAVGLTVTGGVVHTVALNFGTVAVVQALGTLTLLLALPIAAVRTRTPVSAGAWRDAGLTAAGLVLLMSLAQQSTSSATLSADACRYLVLGTVGTVVALAVVAWQASVPVLRSVLLATASGVAFGVNAVVTKVVLESITVLGVAAVAALAVTGYLLGQAAYRGGGLAAPLAAVSVSNPVVATLVGMALLGEGFRFGTTGLVLAGAAGLMAAIGVVGLSRRTSAQPSAPVPVATPARPPVAVG